MRNLIIFATGLPLALSFVVVPYIQIDYAHMFRLAQCKAKCTESYGVADRRELLDGTHEDYFITNSEDHQKCEIGCQQNRRGHKRLNLTGPTLQGTKFWAETTADASKRGSSPISKVELLCQSPSVAPEMDDTFEGIVGLARPRSSGPVQFVVQWKQRTYALGYYEESAWITASVESDTLIKVEGLIPGVQYRFMITVIGPNGRLGDSVTSEWAEISPHLGLKAPSAPLIVKNGYNSEHGVIAQVHFQRTAYDSCNYRIEIRNETSTISKNIGVDPSLSILLPHLEFDSSYVVTLAAVGADNQTTSKSISTQFNSFQCAQVYGRGSINCVPDPVNLLKVAVESNGSTVVSWSPSAPHDAILTYQISYKALIGPCNKHLQSVYVGANSTSYEMMLPRLDCEYVVRVTNYDTLGREAFAETRVNFIRSSDAQYYPLLFIVLPIAALVIILLVLSICCCCCTSRFSDRVAEKKTHLTEYI